MGAAGRVPDDQARCEEPVTQVPPLIDRVLHRISEAPAWLQPPLLGPCIALWMMLGRIWFYGPPVAALALWLGGLAGLWVLFRVIVIVAVAGFAGGLGWTVATPLVRWFGRPGRHLRGWLTVGSYLTPAMWALDQIGVRGRHGTPGIDSLELGIALALTLLFGSLMAEWWTVDERARPRWRQRKQRQTSRVSPGEG
jgi:hypothetical protein